jgi:glycosyltransferase involved in cell wall biosynthesis
MYGNFSFSRKKIVYVTSAWAGLIDVLTGDRNQPKGMPAFFYPLIELRDQGAIIELIVFTSQLSNRQIVSSIYLKNISITILPWPYRKSIFLLFVLIYSFIQMHLVIKKAKPDFIYALGVTGVLGLISSKILNIPVGVRVFGINKYFKNYMTFGKIKFIVSSPLLFLLFRLKSDFLLATDDGSSANKLFQKIGNKKSKILFWKNGFNSDILFSDKDVEDKPFILYPSRILDKKQQVKAVELLHFLDLKGCKSMKLKLVGHITSQKYFDQVFEYVKSVGLQGRVQYCGTLDKKELFSHMKGAEVVLSLQKTSNLGNTLIEALSCESVVLSYKEPSLEAFLKNGESAILVDNISSAGVAILAIQEHPALAIRLRKQGKKALYSEFENWNDRISNELAQIYDVIT